MTSDIDEIRPAIGAAMRLYIERPTIYRAFEGHARHPNFKTVLNVLDAMGFQLHVTVRRDARARLACPKAVPSDSAERHE